MLILFLKFFFKFKVLSLKILWRNSQKNIDLQRKTLAM
jgi:hypothetical protein